MTESSRSNDLSSLFYPFPKPQAGEDIIAAGGNLSLSLLLHAYGHGIFPWYDEPPILWWSPEERWILRPEKFHLPKRSARKLAKHPFKITFDTAFEQVINSCARLRQNNTWITDDIIQAYTDLHYRGYAHSVEAWLDGRLAGGLYGVALNRAFFGESMFHHVSEASRAALAGLVNLLINRNFILIDCQQKSDHMLAAGAEALARKDFMNLLDKACGSYRYTDNLQELAQRWLPWQERLLYNPADDEWEKIS